MLSLAADPILTVGGVTTFQPSILPNAEIPYECFNPVVYNIYQKYLPIPSVNGVPVAVPTTLATQAKQPRNDYNGLARVDYMLGHGHTIDARYYVTNVDDVTANSVSANGTADANYDLDFNGGGDLQRQHR